MVALQSRMDSRSPVPVVALSGSLDQPTIPDAGLAVWECLADMPEVVVIDSSALTVSPAGWVWLADLGRRAARWPGARLCLAGPVEPPDHAGPQHYRTVPDAVQAQAAPSQRRRTLTLPADPSSCSHARDLVDKVCSHWGINRPRRAAELLISEIVANGVRHARTDLVVTVRLIGSALEISVRDLDGTGLPAPGPDPRGFGLQLVDQLSDSWGWVGLRRGKVVWSRLPA